MHPTGPALRLYRALSPLLAAATPLAARFSAKLARGVEGRRGLMERLLAAAPHLRGGVWFHVTSVGEYEQARPIIAAIREQDPDTPIMVTHFSPSGYEYARRRPCADLHDYLPLDKPADMARLMHAWQPRLLIFVKFDLWPNLVLAATSAAVPTVLLAGSLQPGSGRLHPVVRSMYRDLCDRFSSLGVCTEADAARFRADLGTDTTVEVTGDTRVEQVILRWEAARGGETSGALDTLGGRFLVLGSTWPPDENLWLPVVPELLNRFADLRVILTPHEPTDERLADLERKLDRAGVTHSRLSMLTSGDHADPGRVVLTDSIGVLAEIYRSGHLAYVGGSFTTGVHNTMEPAVCSLPVFFGPKIANAEEAGTLVTCGAGRILTVPRDALAAATDLLADDNERRRVGDLAHQVVLDQRGATARSLALIRPWLVDATHT